MGNYHSHILQLVKGKRRGEEKEKSEERMREMRGDRPRKIYQTKEPEHDPKKFKLDSGDNFFELDLGDENSGWVGEISGLPERTLTHILGPKVIKDVWLSKDKSRLPHLLCHSFSLKSSTHSCGCDMFLT